jgi:hypothetical protein
MRALIRTTIAIGLVATLPLGCGGSDENSNDQQVRDVEIASLAAYECMPSRLRSELRQLEKRHDARVREIARASLPKGATGGATVPPGFQQQVERDPVRLRLLRRARVIYQRYSPGGKDYDPPCYLRERERARNRLENAAGS